MPTCSLAEVANSVYLLKFGVGFGAAALLQERCTPARPMSVVRLEKTPKNVQNVSGSSDNPRFFEHRGFSVPLFLQGTAGGAGRRRARVLDGPRWGSIPLRPGKAHDQRRAAGERGSLSEMRVCACVRSPSPPAEVQRKETT